MVSERAQQRRREKLATQKAAVRSQQAQQGATVPAAAVPAKVQACMRFQRLASAPEHAAVSVVSWNCLSDTFATQASLPWADPAHLAWEVRAPALRMELVSMAADIVCLQEVDAARWDEIRSWLPGYNALLQDGKKQRAAAMRLAIFWRPHLRMTWSEHRSRSVLAEFELPAEAAATADTAASSSHRLLLANVHLEGHPHRPHDRISQVCNWSRITSGTSASHILHANIPFVLCLPQSFAKPFGRDLSRLFASRVSWRMNTSIWGAQT